MNIPKTEVHCPDCGVLIGYELRIADTAFFDLGDGFIRTWGYVDCPKCNCRIHRRINVGKFIKRANKVLKNKRLDQQIRDIVEGLVMAFLSRQEGEQ